MRFLYVFLSVMFMTVATMAQVVELPAQDFLVQVLDAIKAFGGLTQVGKIALVITIVISSMKVSFMNQYLWAKLGKFQASFPLVLGLIAGIMTAGMEGKLPTLAEAFAYIGAGAGAIIFHELLDMVKSIPGIGPMWTSFINLIQGFLGKK